MFYYYPSMNLQLASTNMSEELDFYFQSNIPLLMRKLDVTSTTNFRYEKDTNQKFNSTYPCIIPHLQVQHSSSSTYIETKIRKFLFEMCILNSREIFSILSVFPPSKAYPSGEGSTRSA